MCTNAITIFNNKHVQGTIRFHQCEEEDETLVTFDLYGLVPNKMMGCHIHEYGDYSNGCKSLGGHWNPDENTHGYIHLSIPNQSDFYSVSHAGDLLNNILADDDGLFQFKYSDHRINIKGDVDNSIIGRSVVIHNEIDDLGIGGNSESLKTGNAGSRIACAIIAHTK